MASPVTAGADASAVTTPTFRRAALKGRLRPQLTWATLWSRLIRALGRAAMNLPASTWMLLDVSVLALAVYVAFDVFPPALGLITPHVALWQALAVFSFGLVIASLVFGLYERETVRSRSRILLRMGLTSVTATAISYAIIYVVMYSTVGRRATALAMSTFLVSGVAIRLAAWWVVQRVQSGLLVVGTRTLFESFEACRVEGFLRAYRLVGYATTEPDTADTDHKDCVGTITDQIPRLQDIGVTDIVVGQSAARGPNVMDWMVPCLQSGCRVTNEAIFYETATGQILVDEITPSWFLFADLKVHCDQQAGMKRAVDLIISSLGLLLSAPLWLLIAVVIKLGDRGPVFYSQDRVGEHGKTFRLYKFRTMRPNSENGKSVWCAQNDSRITTVGRFLRRTRLDELPQLYNVLIGQMSLVGPRPERPDIVSTLVDGIPYYGERHLVKPGITGWAQISFRYGASVEDAKRKLQFDLYYLKHMSFELDIIILFRTAGTFLRGAC